MKLEICYTFNDSIKKIEKIINHELIFEFIYKEEILLDYLLYYYDQLKNNIKQVNIRKIKDIYHINILFNINKIKIFTYDIKPNINNYNIHYYILNKKIDSSYIIINKLYDYDSPIFISNFINKILIKNFNKNINIDNFYIYLYDYNKNEHFNINKNYDIINYFKKYLCPICKIFLIPSKYKILYNLYNNIFHTISFNIHFNKIKYTFIKTTNLLIINNYLLCDMIYNFINEDKTKYRVNIFMDNEYKFLDNDIYIDVYLDIYDDDIFKKLKIKYDKKTN
jgi:hypothetical protein